MRQSQAQSDRAIVGELRLPHQSMRGRPRFRHMPLASQPSSPGQLSSSEQVSSSAPLASPLGLWEQPSEQSRVFGGRMA